MINTAISGYALHQDLARLLSVENDSLSLRRRDPARSPRVKNDVSHPGRRRTELRSVCANAPARRIQRTDRSPRPAFAQSRFRGRTGTARISLRAALTIFGAPSWNIAPSRQVRRCRIEPIDAGRRVQAEYSRRADAQIAVTSGRSGRDFKLDRLPQLRLSRKPLADREPRLAEYDRAVGGPVEIHTFETLYPLIAKPLTEDARVEGYGLDLTSDLRSPPTRAGNSERHRPRSSIIIPSR